MSSQCNVYPEVCVPQCDAINGGLPTYTWKIRLSFLVYVIAVETTIGEPINSTLD